MNPPRVPSALVGGVADLAGLFASSARYRGIPRATADRVASLVPDIIRRAPCFLDRVTALWRYEFGEPFAGLPSGGTVLGTQMYPSVDRLLDVLACAQQRLTAQQLAVYIARLADPKKHEDMLFEFAPIMRLHSTTQANYEVEGLGEGNRTIDWLLTPPAGPPMALEVKNRSKDLLESLVRLQAGERQVDGTAPPPIHDPSVLFTSVEQKFRPRSSTEIVQAAWIRTALKQEESELAGAFAKLDPCKVHVALLGDWKDDVHALSHDDAARRHACSVLCVRETRRFVFTRGEITTGGPTDEGVETA